MAAVLYACPAALAGESALVASGVRNVTEDLIRVCVATSRKVVAPPGVGVTRLKDFKKRVQWNRSPPRIRIEEAALDVASRAWQRKGEGAAVAVLADLCQQRLSTPDRLLKELDSHPRLPGRAFIRALLDDVSTGAFSLWNIATSRGSKRLTDCRSGSGKTLSSARAAQDSGMFDIQSKPFSSSSTGAWATSSPRTSGPIWRATWRQRRGTS